MAVDFSSSLNYFFSSLDFSKGPDAPQKIKPVQKINKGFVNSKKNVPKYLNVRRQYMQILYRTPLVKEFYRNADSSNLGTIIQKIVTEIISKDM